MALEIPLDTYPSFNIRADLDEVEYQLAFRFLDRSQTWIMDIYTAEGTVIKTGIACLLNTPLLDELTGTRPPGDLYFLDSSQANVEAAQADFGTRVTLNYLTRDEINALTL